MTADDILREKYRREQVRRTQTNPNVLRQRQSASLQQNRQKSKPKNTNYRSVNNYVNNVRRMTENLGRKLTRAELAGALIGTAAKEILDVTTKNIKMVAMGGLALLGIIGYLKEKHTYDVSGYSNIDRFLGKEPGVQGGFGALKSSGRSSGKIGAKGLQLIKNKEGFRENAYHLPGEKHWTIGYGHYGPDVKPGDKITKEQAEELLRKDVARFENCVNKHVKVPISQNMFDALVSFCYNVGTGAFAGSTLLKKLNKGDYKGAQAEFAKWTKGSDGKQLAGLVKRRGEEAALFGVDISDTGTFTGQEINQEVSRQTITPSSAGKTQKFQTKGTAGSGNPSIGNYELWNPNTKRGYIELSDRAQKYLAETGGTGIVTSGSEGSHASGTVSHGAGNKIDVVARGNSNEAWANCAIPFIKNKNTAFINFEDFDDTRFNAIKKIIYSKISRDLIDKCERPQKWLNSRKEQPFLTRVMVHTKPQLHLDIGILPNAYDPKTEATQTKTNQAKEIPPKPQPQKQQSKQSGQQTGKGGAVVMAGGQKQQKPAGKSVSLDNTNYESSKYKLLDQKKKNQKS